jgi:hypothetical protein
VDVGEAVPLVPFGVAIVLMNCGHMHRAFGKLSTLANPDPKKAAGRASDAV